MARTLSREDRSFFEKVAEAVFSNPFAKRRDDLDYEIAGVERSLSQEELLQAVISSVHERLKALDGKETLDVRSFSGRDRELLGHAVLFDVFHRHYEAFDLHIEAQLAAGSEPVDAGFAPQILREIEARGFSKERAERALAIFFQLRRAYFFLKNLSGRSPSMARLRERLWENLFTRDLWFYEQHLWDRMEDFSTLLLGETGCGKGAVAAAIGRSGYIPYRRQKRAFAESFTRNFQSINLSQFPESLMESELFGHCKGAFTGAIAKHDGIFARGSQFGAIFLDEIGEISEPVQVKLLRVLQERTFTPVGSQTEQRFDGRVVAATNKDMNGLRQEGRFRDDLFYRLSTDVIEIPSLRERLAEDSGELEVLVQTVMRQRIGMEETGFSSRVCEELMASLPENYSWPGNVRELEQAVRRILMKGRYEGDLGKAEPFPVPTQGRDGVLTAHEVLSRYCKQVYELLGTYEEVARQLDLDPRTVKKYLKSA